MIQVLSRRRDGPIAQLLRDDADVHAFGAELGGVRVPEAVGVNALLDAGLALPDPLLRRASPVRVSPAAP